MDPLAGGEGGRVESLLGPAVFDREAQARAVGGGGEEEVLVGVVAEIEDALPGRAAVPVNPGGEAERVVAGDIGGQVDEGVGAVERERAGANAGVGVGGRADGLGVVGVARVVERVAVEGEVGDERGGPARRGAGGEGVAGAVERAVGGADAVVVGRAREGGGIGEGGGGEAARDGVEGAVGRSGGAEDGVAVEVGGGDGVPREADGDGVGGGGEAGRRGRPGELDGGVHREQAPVLVEAVERGPLPDVGAVGGGEPVHVEGLAAPAVADGEPAVADVFKKPLLVRAGGGVPLDDVGPVVVGKVEQVGGLAAVGGGEGEVAVVAADAGIERGDVPLLVGGGGAGGGVLPDVGAVAGAGVGDLEDLAAVAVDEDVAAVDGRRHVGAPGDVDQFFGVGLVHPVAVAAGDGDGVGALRAVAVEEHGAVAGDEAVAGGDGLAFGGADEGLHGAGRRAVNGGGGPIRAMLGVAQAHALVGFHECGAGELGAGPPDAGLHAVFGADDGLDDVVQLLVHGLVAAGAHVLVEGGVAVEVARELVGGALGDAILDRVVPGVGGVAAERARAGEGDVGEGRAGLEQTEDVVKVGDGALVPAVVGLVEGRGGDEGFSPGLEGALGGLHGFDPAGGHDLGAVFEPRIDAGLGVGRHGDGFAGAGEGGDVEAVDEAVELGRGELTVHQRGVDREGDAHEVHLVLAHVDDAPAHVVRARPGGVQAPLGDRLGDARRAGVEDHGAILRGGRVRGGESEEGEREGGRGRKRGAGHARGMGATKRSEIRRRGAPRIVKCGSDRDQL